MSRKIKHSFKKSIEWLPTLTLMADIEMAYTVASDWNSDIADDLSFRVMKSDGMDLTTIIAMERPLLFREIRLACLKHMETLVGEPEQDKAFARFPSIAAL